MQRVRRWLRSLLLIAIAVLLEGAALHLSITGTLIELAFSLAPLGLAFWGFDDLRRLLEQPSSWRRKTLVRVAYVLPFGIELVRQHQALFGMEALVLTMMLDVALFATLGDLTIACTARARTIRVRLALLATLSTAVGVLASRTLNLGYHGRLAQLLGSMAIPLAFALVFASTLSAKLTRALDEVVQALRRVASGELGTRIRIQGRDELAELAQTFNATTEQLADRAFVEQAFGRYVTPTVLEQLRAQRELRLASVRRDATVLYADIRGFTALSESATPETVMALLNVYFERVVEVIAGHEGYVNKFIGDAVMVVFNAPHDQPDHAARAVTCALAMQRAVQTLNASGDLGEGRTLHVGIGVNTGPLVAGSLGSASRVEYTVIGDTVNVAARLTSAARPDEVLLGELTAQACGRKVEALEPISVKGKRAPLRVFRASLGAGDPGAVPARSSEGPV